VVDSFSTDSTRELCAAHPQVRFFTRAFDSHAQQWTYAVHETAIATDWVLAMDADYLLTPGAEREIDALPPVTDNAGYWLSFRYAVFGKVLKCGIYPPVMALFRRDKATYVQDGHSQRVVVDGPAGAVMAKLVHDDRKSLDRWLTSQIAYARLEAEKPNEINGLKSWLRLRTPLAPLIIGFHVLILRRGVFEGPPGWLYAMQRILAEALASCARLNRLLTQG